MLPTQLRFWDTDLVKDIWNQIHFLKQVFEDIQLESSKILTEWVFLNQILPNLNTDEFKIELTNQTYSIYLPLNNYY